MSRPIDSDIYFWGVVHADDTVTNYTNVDFLPAGYVQVWEARRLSREDGVMLCTLDMDFAFLMKEYAYHFAGGVVADVSVILPPRGVALEAMPYWGPAGYKQLSWQTNRGD